MRLKLLLSASLVQATTLGLYGDANLPIDPGNNKDTRAVFAAVDHAFDKIIQTNLAVGQQVLTNETSFSFAVFDKHRTLYTYHHTADESTLDPASTKRVSNDTVYRIGSTSKLITVYTFLVAAGWAHWHAPITKYVPELHQTCSPEHDPINCFDWNEITLETLASHLSGVPDGFEPIDYDPQAFGIPQKILPPSVLSPSQKACNGMAGEIPKCPATTYEEGMSREHPVFAPWSQPSYSNGAFQLLAAALERILDAPFPAILENTIFKPLHMSSSYHSVPPTSAGIIPGDAGSSAWNQTFNRGGPEGGFYSSSADLVKLGQSIMNHRLLSPMKTRRWMKPISHTASLRQSVGAPWEILRQSPRDSLHSVDLYTKAGDIGAYHANLALVPQLGIGYILLSAGGSGLAIDNQVSDLMLSGFETVAHTQARRNIAGAYRHCKDSQSKTSLVLAVEDNAPGVNITRLLINGTDVLGLLKGSGTDLRAYPAGLSRTTKHGTQIASWRMLGGVPAFPDQQSQELHDSLWTATSDILYGYTTSSEVLMETDKDGKVLTIDLRFFDVKFQR